MITLTRNKKTLAIVINSFNRIHKLKRALDSVRDIADEIIVVDHGSSDGSYDLARQYIKKVYRRKNDPFNIDQQKNYGISKATMDYTFLLDDDEWMIDELKKEIRDEILDEKK